MKMIPSKMLSLFLILCVSLCMTGCGTTQAIIIGSDDIVRTGSDVEGHVYTWDGEKWIKSDNKVRIPEGMYIVPPTNN
tara:strand:+ start:220 stop:453 length:234 start_codon:yes stop_codon:yes gene_type:complete